MTTLYLVCLVLLALCLVPCVYRIAFGPNRMDRLLAMDLIGVVLVTILGVYSLLQQTSMFMDIAMGLAVLSFVGTLAFAAYATRRRVL